MPCFASSTAIARVSPFSPALAATYAASPALARSAWREEMLTMAPCPARRMCGIPARAHHIGAVRSTRRIASHAAVVRSATVASRASPPAALLTSTVNPPSTSADASTSRVHAASSWRSAATNEAVARRRGPAVGPDPAELPSAFVDHRFDRERHAGHEPVVEARVVVVRYRRCGVELLADAVADERPHHREPRRFGVVLDRTSDVVEPGAGANRVDRLPQRFLGDLDEPATFVVDVADQE